MKIIILIQVLLLSSIALCYGQKNGKKKSSISENKSITFCQSQTDTLTYEQFKNCKTIFVKGKKSSDIVSFIYSVMHDNTLYEVSGIGNTINERMFDLTISKNIKKAIIENVMVKVGEKTINYGHRFIYFK